MSRPNVSAHVSFTAPTTVALTRSDGVAEVIRNGAGDYSLVFPDGQAVEGAEYHLKVTPIGTTPLIAQLGDVGGPAPGAATGGSRAVQVLIFDEAGAPADADFLFAATRV